MTPTPGVDMPPATHSVWPERIAAMTLFALGAAFLLKARDYGVGAAHHMGPGYVPAVLGATLCIIATLIGLTHRKGGADEPVAWRPLLMIAGGMVTFVLAMPRFGLVPALFLCTLIASRADRHTTSAQAAGVAVAMAGSAWLLFVEILGLPIPPFGSGR